MFAGVIVCKSIQIDKSLFEVCTSSQYMFDIVDNNPEVLEACKNHGITPLIIGEDVELVSKPTKTSNKTLTIATSSDREVLQSNIDAVTDIESHKKDDFMHHRNSGLDQVSATLLSQVANAYIINLHTLLHAKNQAVTLGRILQNAKIVKKFNIPVLLASFAQTPQELPTVHDHHAHWRALGIPEKLLVESQQHYQTLLDRAKMRASNGYVAEGVQRQS